MEMVALHPAQIQYILSMADLLGTNQVPVVPNPLNPPWSANTPLRPLSRARLFSIVDSISWVAEESIPNVPNAIWSLDNPVSFNSFDVKPLEPANLGHIASTNRSLL